MAAGLLLLVLLSGTPARAVAAADRRPAPGPAYTETTAHGRVRFEMVPIPGGTFRMGSPPGEMGRRADEGPTFRVEVDPFWMGKYEVTWDEFDEFRREYERVDASRRLDQKKDWKSNRWIDAVSLPTPLWEQDSGPILSGLGEAGGFPVADISNYAARQYTKWLSKKTGHFYRLPTEAEWEYAARAGTETAFSFGEHPEDLNAYGWYFDNSLYEDDRLGHPEFGAGYRKVGLKKPNPWGLYDMHGNVSEWVIDQYIPDHYAKFAGKTVHWRDAIAWPTTIFPRVARGGNWNSEAAGCRSAARLPSDKSWQRRDPQFPKSIWWYTDSFHVGFRLLRPRDEPSEQEKRKYWDADTDADAFVLKTNGKNIRATIERDDANLGGR